MPPCDDVSHWWLSSALRSHYCPQSWLCLMAPTPADAQRSLDPEVDSSIEVVAVSLGGREVLAHAVEDGLIVRTDGYRVAAISGKRSITLQA